MRQIITSILNKGSYESKVALKENNPLLVSEMIQEDSRLTNQGFHYVLTEKGQNEVGEFFRPKSKIQVFDLELRGSVIHTHSTDFNCFDYSIIREAILKGQLEEGSEALRKLRKCLKLKIVKVTKTDYLIIRQQ
jgi:hypothetical protein